MHAGISNSIVDYANIKINVTAGNEKQKREHAKLAGSNDRSAVKPAGIAVVSAAIDRRLIFPRIYRSSMRGSRYDAAYYYSINSDYGRGRKQNRICSRENGRANRIIASTWKTSFRRQRSPVSALESPIRRNLERFCSAVKRP